ncbi:ribosomal protein S5 domain 2-type protein [Gongronella butleri]|nr:ribosomal protein S5 domain 2-type protein [Gongronella butleri]
MDPDQEQQEEERLAVCAIYGDDVLQLDEANSTAEQAVYTLLLNIDQDNDMEDAASGAVRSPRTLQLRLFFPGTYPSADKPVFEVLSKYCGSVKVDEHMTRAIQDSLDELFLPGVVVLFDWIQAIREYMEDHVPHDDRVDDDDDHDSEGENAALVDARAATPPPPTRSRVPSVPVPKIYSGDPLVDRKSTFVAHIAAVHNTDEIQAVMDTLLSNNKIFRATHNMMAYRIKLDGGRVLQDSDDDGESAAGGRLLHLLQILQVENVMVVVSRWYGGIKLGADRFKDINNCARKALEDCGYIKDDSGKKGKK